MKKKKIKQNEQQKLKAPRSGAFVFSVESASQRQNSTDQNEIEVLRKYEAGKNQQQYRRLSLLRKR